MESQVHITHNNVHVLTWKRIQRDEKAYNIKYLTNIQIPPKKQIQFQHKTKCACNQVAQHQSAKKKKKLVKHDQKV
jgi:hypothetical protein